MDCTAGFGAKDGRVRGGQGRVQEVGEPGRMMKGAIQNNTLDCFKRLATRAEMRMRIVRVRDNVVTVRIGQVGLVFALVAASCAAGIIVPRPTPTKPLPISSYHSYHPIYFQAHNLLVKLVACHKKRIPEVCYLSLNLVIPNFANIYNRGSPARGTA